MPYATGGVGGLTMFERPAVGVFNDETFLTGNVGGGIKWYAPNNRWGLRETIGSSPAAPRMTRRCSSAATPVTRTASMAP